MDHTESRAPEEAADPKQEEGQLRRVLLGVGAYLLFRWGLGVIQLPLGTPPWVLLLASAITSLGAIGLPIVAMAALVRMRPVGREHVSAGTALGLTVLGLALWFGLAALVRLPHHAPQGAGRFGFPLVFALEDLGKILAAAGVGMALGGAIRDPNILVPAGLFAGFADIVVVTIGTVHHVQSTAKGQKLLHAVSATAPKIHPALATLTVGPADFLFLGFFLACAAKFGMGLARNAVILALVLGVSLFLVSVFPISVPALAPMSVAFVAANWQRFRLTRDELVGTAIVLAAAGGLFFAYFRFIYGRH